MIHVLPCTKHMVTFLNFHWFFPNFHSGSLKGKEDGSTKSKKGRKVQFDSDLSSPLSAGKTESLFAKGASFSAIKSSPLLILTIVL